jgi:hypothetical protein
MGARRCRTRSARACKPVGQRDQLCTGYSRPTDQSRIAVSPGSQKAQLPLWPRRSARADLRAFPPGIRGSAPLASSHRSPRPRCIGPGIVDTVGTGHRLLVTGPSGGPDTVWAIDCRGSVTSIEPSPRPRRHRGAGFGHYGGQLVAPNEGDGSIYAVSETGQLTGGRGSAYHRRRHRRRAWDSSPRRATAYRRRGTRWRPASSWHRQPAATQRQLTSVGVRKGDLLVATEGGNPCPHSLLVTVRRRHYRLAPAAHGEGHLLLVPPG